MLARNCLTNQDRSKSACAKILGTSQADHAGEDFLQILSGADRVLSMQVSKSHLLAKVRMEGLYSFQEHLILLL